MNNMSRGLGKGLNALIPTAVSADEPKTSLMVSVKEIYPNKFQPRRIFEEEALAELAHSIKQYGILQPVVVRKTMQGYELVAGERRWRASQLAGLKEIPALLKEYTDGEMTEIALIENIQRENLNPVEEAFAYRRLMEEFGLTQEEVARKIGRSRSLIANTIRLLNLQPLIQDYVSRGTLSMGQARPLLALESAELQMEAAEMIIAEDLSARDAEELVKRLAITPKEKRSQVKEEQPQEFFVVEAQDRLKMILGTQVRIKPGKLKSKIEIEFYSQEDLDRIVEVLTSPQEIASSRPPSKLIV